MQTPIWWKALSVSFLPCTCLAWNTQIQLPIITSVQACKVLALWWEVNPQYHIFSIFPLGAFILTTLILESFPVITLTKEWGIPTSHHLSLPTITISELLITHVHRAFLIGRNTFIPREAQVDSHPASLPLQDPCSQIRMPWLIYKAVRHWMLP